MIHNIIVSTMMIFKQNRYVEQWISLHRAHNVTLMLCGPSRQVYLVTLILIGDKNF